MYRFEPFLNDTNRYDILVQHNSLNFYCFEENGSKKENFGVFAWDCDFFMHSLVV